MPPTLRQSKLILGKRVREPESYSDTPDHRNTKKVKQIVLDAEATSSEAERQGPIDPQARLAEQKDPASNASPSRTNEERQSFSKPFPQGPTNANPLHINPPDFDIASLAFSDVKGQMIKKRGDLDLVYFKRFLKTPGRERLMDYLLKELPWYRVSITHLCKRDQNLRQGMLRACVR